MHCISPTSTSSLFARSSNSSHPTVQKPSHRKLENSSSASSSSSSSETERSSDDRYGSRRASSANALAKHLSSSVSCKSRRRNPTKNHSSLNDSMGKSKVLKIFHLPAKIPSTCSCRRSTLRRCLHLSFSRRRSIA